MRLRIYGLLLLLLALLLTACGDRHPPGFVVLPGAQGVKNYYVRGMDKALYRIEVDFPAEKVIQQISDNLKHGGWKPLDYLYLYPDVPGSTKQGWTFYEQTKKGTDGWMVYEWSTDWVDPEGNIASYALQYRDPIMKYRQNTFVMRPGNNGLVVNFVYMPKQVAVTVKESMKPKKPETR